MNKEILKDALYSTRWGTCGPHFEKASADAAKALGGNFGLLTHSLTAAYEATLRSLGLGHGDKILVASYSDRMDSEVAIAIGVIPVFAKSDSNGITPEAIEASLNQDKDIQVVVVDYFNTMKLEEIKSICSSHNVKLVLNADIFNGTQFNLDGIFALVVDFGICGIAVTNQEETYVALFAWHHCGHAPGTAASLSFEELVGGDLRITEWQAIEVYDLIKIKSNERPISAREYINAPENPLLKTKYYHKMTGI